MLLRKLVRKIISRFKIDFIDMIRLFYDSKIKKCAAGMNPYGYHIYIYFFPLYAIHK